MATLTAEAVRNARMHFYFPYLCDHGHRQNGAPYGKCQSCDSPNVWPIQTISPLSLAPLPPLRQRWSPGVPPWHTAEIRAHGGRAHACVAGRG